MNINAATSYNQNFQARIKINKPNLKVLAQSAIGTSALAAGGASIAEGGFSANAVFNENPYSIESIPKEAVDSHKEMLTSAGHGYDAAGEWEGIPCQTTVAPMGMIASGVVSSNAAVNAYKKALNDNNMDVSANSSMAISANKSVQKSMLGAGYLGTAAASLYSGFNGEEVNHMLPHSVQSHAGYNPHPEVDDCASYVGNMSDASIISGALSLGLPIASGSLNLLSKASDTKSSQFVADTLSDGKTGKKIPS